MSYIQYDQTKPDGTGNGSATLQHMRENMTAMRDMVLLGAAPGWAYAPSGGTAEQPATMTFSKGVERLRAVLTWGTTGGSDGNATAVALSYSSNSGTSYVAIGTQTINYDSAGNVTSTTWS